MEDLYQNNHISPVLKTNYIIKFFNSITLIKIGRSLRSYKPDFKKKRLSFFKVKYSICNSNMIIAPRSALKLPKSLNRYKFSFKYSHETNP